MKRSDIERFVSGRTIDECLKLVKELNSEGFQVTIDHLGEGHEEIKEVEKAVTEYLKVLEEIDKKNLNCSISIKLSQIGLAMNYGMAFENLAQILDKAKKLGIFIEIDMEESKYTEKTLDIAYRNMKKRYDFLQALQCKLHRSEADLKKIINLKGKIRMVKGTYNEPKRLALQTREIIRKRYLKFVRMYLKKGRYIEIATHDVEIIKKVKEIVKKEKISKSRYCFALLYGCYNVLGRSLVDEGYPVKIYLPYGQHVEGYVNRRLNQC